MDGHGPRRWRAGDNFNTKGNGRQGHPDRLAFWALLLCLFMLAVAAASAKASTGGIVTGVLTAPPGTVIGPIPAASTQFGSRVLRVGMQGNDVKVLNGIVKSKAYAPRVRVGDLFGVSTAGAVKHFQRAAGLPTSGVVNTATSGALVRSMDMAGATWYGPGFYGHSTACGQVLRRATIGVANRSLPCGTKVTFAFHGHSLVAPVIDRGPYTAGYKFDLTGAAAEALGVSTSISLHYAVARPGSDRRGL